jgi:uncharacterized protein YqeY
VIADRLREELRAALKSRDRATAGVLRAALAAIDNAGAVDSPAGRRGLAIEESPEGPGAAEAERRTLTEADVARIVRAEIDDREAAARHYESAGHAGGAARLRGEANVLRNLIAAIVTDTAANP